MSGWQTTIATGNPQVDQMTVEQHRQAAAQQGLSFDVQPLPTGGYTVRAFAPQQQQWAPQQPPPQQWAPQQPQSQQWALQQPQQQQWAPQQPAVAAAGGMTFSTVSTGSGSGSAVAVPLTQDRVKYLRKVYGLLTLSVIIAGVAGLCAVSLGPTTMMRDSAGHRVAVPILTAILLSSRVAMYGAFGLLFVGTMAASAVSKVRGLNLVALLGVSALMGVEAAPMVFVAQFLGAQGKTLSAAPVLDTFLLVGAVFVGVTAYVLVTKKDFSFLAATLNMGFWIVFAGCIAAIVFRSDVFSLAIASVGAIVAAGFLLMQTSRIFRNSAMDDAVGDCLGLLVQLRNLFLFILRILMSSRR